ncbi:hypothetical protein M404DRAFT_1006915 [Pisolithus tinctorius Marx 270]|uniref:Uncharacterized protein n=1 Tax=Pisolithus tinctorius Marx 270 TaxID=870435 RepID=A0A0C3NKH8_PISTI|nr:hypothetical protein M404DRAFT_1006915 [Pisolithus tinctorius Marx 270]
MYRTSLTEVESEAVGPQVRENKEFAAVISSLPSSQDDFFLRWSLTSFVLQE